MDQENRLKHIVRMFEKEGGVMRTSQLLEKGGHRRDLYKLRDQKKVIEIDRGLYQLADIPEPSFSDFVIVSKKIPRGVICLLSALAFHELTMHIPHFVYLAIPDNARKSRLKYPPIRYFWYTDLDLGAEEHKINGHSVIIFNVEKTLADCVKFRHKIGMDILYEALKTYWNRGSTDLDKLFAYAKQLRVESILQPIMEIIVHE